MTDGAIDVHTNRPRGGATLLVPPSTPSGVSSLRGTGREKEPPGGWTGYRDRSWTVRGSMERRSRDLGRGERKGLSQGSRDVERDATRADQKMLSCNPNVTKMKKGSTGVEGWIVCPTFLIEGIPMRTHNQGDSSRQESCLKLKQTGWCLHPRPIGFWLTNRMSHGK